MPQYLLALRDDPADFSALSAEEMQRVIQKYRSWRESNASRIASGQKLKDGVARVLRKNGANALVTDGPFAESKEVLGGYFLIEAAGMEQAIELASSCPHMEFGSIEVREIERT